MSDITIRILHVEDSTDDQLILKRSLEDNMPVQFELTTVDTGTKGLKKIEKEQFDVLISDYRLPDITGIDFVKQLKKKKINTPVILVTSKGNENVAVEAMKLGFRDYIIKEEIGTKRLVESIKEIFLKASLPPRIDAETAKTILYLLSKNPSIKLESANILTTNPESKIPVDQMASALIALTDLNILEKEPSRSVIVCPDCDSLTSTLHLECPECSSNKMMKEEALEHFDCGNIDFRSKYDKGEGELICPKCGKRLKVIGVDYRKIENWYKCSNNHHFSQPDFKFTCSRCRKGFSLEQARISMLHNYTLTSDGCYTLKLGIKATEITEKDNAPSPEKNHE